MMLAGSKLSVEPIILILTPAFIIQTAQALKRNSPSLSDAPHAARTFYDANGHS